MIKISESQYGEFDKQNKQKDLDKVAELIKPKFEALQKKTEDESVLFEQWFDQQLLICQEWRICKANNIKSYCEYAIVYYPDFPSNKKFASLLRILESDYDEDNKLDKINYRLLFFRS